MPQDDYWDYIGKVITYYQNQQRIMIEKGTHLHSNWCIKGYA